MLGSSSPARLLRGAAAVATLLGALIAVWLADKAIRYPSTRAVQFGAEAPLWLPFLLFVVGGTLLIVYLFLRAARRVEADEQAVSSEREEE